MSLVEDRRTFLVAALAASLCLHAVAVLFAPHGAIAKLPESTVIELIPLPAPPPPAPVAPPKVEPPRSSPRAARPIAKPVAPATPAATVEDAKGDAPVPVGPPPLPVFKAPLGEPPQQLGPPSRGTSIAPTVVETPAALEAEVKPAYPDEAREAGVDGVVVLRITIGPDGRVEDVKVVETPGFGLEVAARAAILRARFKPATRDGQPARSTITYRYVFRLD